MGRDTFHYPKLLQAASNRALDASKEREGIFFLSWLFSRPFPAYSSQHSPQPSLPAALSRGLPGFVVWSRGGGGGRDAPPGWKEGGPAAGAGDTGRRYRGRPWQEPPGPSGGSRRRSGKIQRRRRNGARSSHRRARAPAARTGSGGGAAREQRERSGAQGSGAERGARRCPAGRACTEGERPRARSRPAAWCRETRSR